MEKIIINFINQHGMTGFIGVLLFFVLRWVMKQAEKSTEISVKREEDQRIIITEQTAVLDRHTKASQELHTENRRANEFQRKEHERIIVLLDKLVVRQNGKSKK